MKSYQRIVVFLLPVLLFTFIVSPWAAILWNSIIEARPEWQAYRYSFSHIFGCLFMVMGVILFFFCRPLLKIQSLSQLGLKSFRDNYQDLLRGSAIALALIELPYSQSTAKVLNFPHVEVR